MYDSTFEVLDKELLSIKYNLTLCDRLILSVKQIYNLVKSKIKNKTNDNY